MHAQNWNQRQDLTGWWLSEKMDGIRAYWDGQKLYSRRGNQIPAPDSFTKDFPGSYLDGELWLGRGSLDKLRIIYNTLGSDWSKVEYVLFDAPSQDEPFEYRYQTLRHLTLPPHVRVANIIRCQGPDHLQEYLNQVLNAGGEGLMAVETKSLYSIGRTPNLLKVKVIAS